MDGTLLLAAFIFAFFGTLGSLTRSSMWSGGRRRPLVTAIVAALIAVLLMHVMVAFASRAFHLLLIPGAEAGAIALVLGFLGDFGLAKLKTKFPHAF